MFVNFVCNFCLVVFLFVHVIVYYIVVLFVAVDCLVLQVVDVAL